MKITKDRNCIILRGVTHFDIHDTFNCGQCFRFGTTAGNAAEGVAYGRFLRIEQPESGTLRIFSTESEYREIWEHFLALDCDYDTVQESIRRAFGGDSVMERAMEICGGIRILRQEPWETLCSFIISQNNNIPRIKGIIDTLCRRYGKPVDTPHGTEYAFPSAADVAKAGSEGMAELKTGFRAKYISAAAAAVSDGTFPLESLADLSTEAAVSKLCTLYGVGLKVASCTALFGLGKTDAFPVDVWVKRILEKYYPQGLDVNSLGEYAGVAQQYLFHYERKLAGAV